MTEREDKIVEDIQGLAKSANDWQRIRTSIPGIFVVRLPGKAMRVMLMFSPVDESGNATKRRGFYFADMTAVQAARRAFPDERLEALVSAIQVINGPLRRSLEDVNRTLEI